MVNVILQLYPQIRATREERVAQRPMGRNAERYQELIRDWPTIIKAADELGLWGVSSIEHHFHSEGYEVGPNPGLLNAYWAAITKRVRIGQLGYTMSAQNPFRVAEDVAVLDHLTGGRSFCGFARGYQARWTNILGQHLGARATLSPSGTPDQMAQLDEAARAARVSDDQVNRAIFEENVELVLQSWMQDSVEWKGRWQVPYPYEDGVDWTMTATRELGAEGEMDEHGRIRRVSVVPKPLTSPHPPVFVSSNASKETVEYCGPRGFVPTYFSRIDRAAEFGGAYVDAAATAGRRYALGQNQALVRWGQMADSEEEARRMVEEYDVDIFRDLYAGTTPMKFDPDDPVGSVVNSGLWVVGTPEQVRDEYVRLWKQLPAEFVVLIYHFAQQPADSVVRQLELFMEHVKPALDELTDYERV
jgi:alkanesulfonate monooxygenase SsuD/methylene tetrahydromethanopterin reductase-like flavin-dependent oxidoreductase (luciferase family)